MLNISIRGGDVLLIIFISFLKLVNIFNLLQPMESSNRNPNSFDTPCRDE